MFNKGDKVILINDLGKIKAGTTAVVTEVFNSKVLVAWESSPDVSTGPYSDHRFALAPDKGDKVTVEATVLGSSKGFATVAIGAYTIVACLDKIKVVSRGVKVGDKVRDVNDVEHKVLCIEEGAVFLKRTADDTLSISKLRGVRRA